MRRLITALRLELTLQWRQKFIHAGVFSGLMWLAILLPIPHHLRAAVEPYVMVGDIVIIGFFFIGAAVFYEKQDRTLSAVVTTPLRFWEYLTAKLVVLTMISVVMAVTVATIAGGLSYHFVWLLLGVVLGALLMLVVGFISSLPFASVSDWFLASTIPMTIMQLPPIVYYSGLWANPVLYVFPTQGPMLLLGAAFDQVELTGWQVGYAVTYPVLCLAVLSRVAKTLFDRYVIERSVAM